ncbi:hypothetical protein B0H10DRAFT_2027394 [Mycena sp. CBHHK59/15]|nr:hypothetical protein B0H10DRAFT_2027394 [Mycena sp. CBHHK59/15]
MSDWVIVDDQSSLIKYTGLWTGGGTSIQYDNTASASRVAGATMTFPFSGTSVAVVGGFDANTSCTGTFSLDSNITTFVSPVLQQPLTHQSIWKSAPLADGPHTLTYTVSSCTSTGNDVGYVWVDYIIYNPSANASADGLVYFVDDSDSRIDYSGNWTVETANDEDFELSSHGGKQGCSFQFEFEGTSVSVHGRIGNDTVGVATQASFSVDGSTPVVFSAPYQSSISYNQPLFRSDTLDKESMSPVLLWFDYLLFQPASSAANVTVPSAPHSGSVTAGEIAGIIVGGLLVVVGIALLVVFRRRLFKRRHYPVLSRPLNLVEVRDVASSSHIPWQSDNAYPPTPSSYSFHSPAPLSHSHTPPISPRSDSFPSSSNHSRRTQITNDHNDIMSVPPMSPSYASSSRHSRRVPSLGGNGDGDFSAVDLKRRQQLVPVADYDQSPTPSSSRAPSTTSSRRPLPTIPPDSGVRPVAGGSGYADDDTFTLDLPPVYTIR